MKVACIKWGSKYPAEYVNRLARAVARHMPAGVSYQFVCYTDDPTGCECTTAPLPGGFYGWWYKLYLFSLQEHILLLDLDSVIVRDMTPLLRADFTTIKDPWQAGYNSSVVAIPPNMPHVWSTFVEQRPDRHLHGDQDWLNRVPGFALDNCYAPGVCQSYKADVRGRGVGAECVLVYFHGEPKPHEVDEEFVKENWI